MGFFLSRLLGQYCSLRNDLIMCIPAILYFLQIVLQYVAATNLDASLCQVLYQMKLLTATLFNVVMLGRQLTRSQWLGILTCAVGVGIVLSSVHVRQKTTKMENQNLWFGFFAVSTVCAISGLAAVYIEKVFKTGEASLWVQNMHLSSWSILAVGGAMFFFLFQTAKRFNKMFFLEMGWRGMFGGIVAGPWGHGSLRCVQVHREYIKRIQKVLFLHLRSF